MCKYIKFYRLGNSAMRAMLD